MTYHLFYGSLAGARFSRTFFETCDRKARYFATSILQSRAGIAPELWHESYRGKWRQVSLES